MCSSHNCPAYWAKHSATQPSRQSSNDTLSPNHWWVFPWTTEASKSIAPYVGRLCVSRSRGPPVGSFVAPTTMAPAEEKGYGPNFAVRKSRISVCSASASGSMTASGLYTVMTGVPAAVFPGRDLAT
ncbi:hypothetical protein [Streptomyces sp. NPDC088246]|uniref:hypothetical protein n=1 Tax=Streptomyces sp. NPDC088246 TaxID=3365842 RepID=UPI003806A150